MADTESSAVTDVLAAIMDRLAAIEKKMEKEDFAPLKELTPKTHLVTISSRQLEDSDYCASAALHLLPTNPMDGKRTAMPDASLHQGDITTANVIVLGASLGLIKMGQASRLIIRSEDECLLQLIDGASFADEGTKSAYLIEDLKILSEQMHVVIETEWMQAGHPELNTINALLDEAEAEYHLRKKPEEKDNVTSRNGNREDS